MYKLSSKSRTKLAGVEEPLVLVVERAIQISSVDFAVTEGLRTLARQKELYAKGRTAPGPAVTWTMKSKHLQGRAVDLVPFVSGRLVWDDVSLFKKIGDAMRQAAHELEVSIRWGYDWDMDGVLQEKGEYDGPHFELI